MRELKPINKNTLLFNHVVLMFQPSFDYKTIYQVTKFSVKLLIIYRNIYSLSFVLKVKKKRKINIVFSLDERLIVIFWLTTLCKGKSLTLGIFSIYFHYKKKKNKKERKERKKNKCLKKFKQ